jgi:mannose/fructose/N-acetylgalactosamine-specific phosphotransferase system component IID
MIVIGALAAGNIKAKTIIQGSIGGSAVVLQDVLDKILPNERPNPSRRGNTVPGL